MSVAERIIKDVAIICPACNYEKDIDEKWHQISGRFVCHKCFDEWTESLKLDEAFGAVDEE